MRTRIAAVVIAVLTVAGLLAVDRVAASPGDEYTGTHFGANNLPPGCENDSMVTYTNNVCHHQRTGMNGLDDPKVDVLVMVPASPMAERDSRIIRQAIDMWDGGIDNLGPQMDLDWLSDGMRFNVQTLIVDPNNLDTNVSPLVDPEIVVILSNPVGGAGIGIDPVDTGGELLGIIAPGAPLTDGQVPCSPVPNPFNLEMWQDLPEWDGHHANAGTYTAEDCNGNLGGNVCFAVNGAIDPAPDTVEVYSLFDLVAHEFGHCLTIGHVGDGAEANPWGKVPTNDIMSYNADPVGLNKCVSTLDVESIAVSMSHYIDVNGDDAVTDADHLEANDPIGDGNDHFQVQHPRDHFYASGTGAPRDCPQPYLGIAPGGPVTNWDPAPVSSSRKVLNVTSPANNAVSSDGSVSVIGTVENVVGDVVPDPTSSTGRMGDSTSDAKTKNTELRFVSANVTAATVDVQLQVEKLPATGTSVTSAVTYSVTIDGRRFDTFVLSGGPENWDNNAGGYLDASTVRWDTRLNKIFFKIPRSYLADNGITAPYQISANSNIGNVTVLTPDDFVPNGGKSFGVAAPVASSASFAGPRLPLLANAAVQNIEDPDDHTFYAEDSTFGVTDQVGLDGSHVYAYNVPQPSDVKFTLTWTDLTGASDLDLGVSHNGTVSEDGISGANPEVVTLHNVSGPVDLTVIPYIVADELDGVSYTLTADVTPLSGGPVDTDGDGVNDDVDECDTVAASTPNGCPAAPNAANERVRVFVDNVLTNEAAVDTNSGRAGFNIPVTIGNGTHTLRIEWVRFGKVVATESRTVSYGAGSVPLP